MRYGTMKEEVGNRDFDIWLLGDSNPRNWQAVLETPFDPRHPARHNVWTPVLEVIQDRVFRECKSRVDASSVYIRNAVEDSFNKPDSRAVEWESAIEEKAQELGAMIGKYKPRILATFGAFSFEFARRAFAEKPERSYGYWGAKRLGQEFRQRIDQFDVDTTNLLPLLHVSIARGRFIQSHDYYCDQQGANYFDFVGNHIAQKLIAHHKALNIWIE